MLERVRARPDKFETRTFIVNVRTPKISGGGEVRLKDREKTSEAWAWDDQLTLEFSGRASRRARGRDREGGRTSPPSTSPATPLPPTSRSNPSTVGARCSRAFSSRRSPWPITANRANRCAASSASGAWTRC